MVYEGTGHWVRTQIMSSMRNRALDPHTDWMVYEGTGHWVNTQIGWSMREQDTGSTHRLDGL